MTVAAIRRIAVPSPEELIDRARTRRRDRAQSQRAAPYNLARRRRWHVRHRGKTIRPPASGFVFAPKLNPLLIAERWLRGTW
jgi:hypothetical protein